MFRAVSLGSSLCNLELACRRLQELNRKANTMLSKTTGGDPGIGLRLTALGLEVKTEIERAREQVQNLE